MRMEAEYIETTPTISFDRFHADSEILTKMTSTVGLAQPKSSSYKKTRTNMESATFKTLEATVRFSVSILWTSDNL